MGLAVTGRMPPTAEPQVPLPACSNLTRGFFPETPSQFVLSSGLVRPVCSGSLGLSEVAPCLLESTLDLFLRCAHSCPSVWHSRWPPRAVMTAATATTTSLATRSELPSP